MSLSAGSFSGSAGHRWRSWMGAGSGFPEKCVRHELAPGEPERLMTLDLIAGGVNGAQPAPVEAERDTSEIHGPTGFKDRGRGGHRKCDRGAVVEDHAEDLVVDAEATVEVADREDGPVVVTAAERVERVAVADPSVPGDDRRLGMGGFPLYPRWW